MNYSTNDCDMGEPCLPSEPVLELQCETDQDSGVFQGDIGRIPHETRRVLIQLLRGPSVDERRQGNLWAVLLRDETVLRERLHELFLELVVDHEQKVAFTRQVIADDIEIPVLLRRANLTFLESVLILFLRQRLTQAATQGDRAVISWSEMMEHLTVYERNANVDHARYDKQRQGAIEKAKKLSFLQKIAGADDRFEVSPTLKLLFPAEEIQALTRTYTKLLHRGQSDEFDIDDETANSVYSLGDDDE